MSNKYFRKSRNIQKSLKKYLETNFASDWKNATVSLVFSDAYSNSNSLPIVIVEMMNKEETRLEIGSSTNREQFGIDLNIFSKSTGLAWDISDYLSEKVKKSFVYYSYANDPSDKSIVIETDSGTNVQFLKFLTNMPLIISDSVHKRDRFRHKISILVEKTL